MSYGGEGGIVSLVAGKKFWMEARVRRDTVTDNELAMFIGLAEDGLCATNSLDINTGDCLVGKDWLGFDVVHANGNAINFIHGDGTGEIVIAGADVVTPTV